MFNVIDMETTDKEKNEKYVKHIMSQTNYNEELAREKLKEFKNDFMKVLKDYMGIPEKKENSQIKSVNQEIYKQLRRKLDDSMREYNSKQESKLMDKIQNP